MVGYVNNVSSLVSLFGSDCTTSTCASPLTFPPSTHPHTHNRPNNPAVSPAGPTGSYFNQPPEETQMESVIQPLG